MEDFIMYEKYLEQLEEAGKIRNLKERSINCYKNYVSYFLKYQNKNPEELTCQDVRTFLLAKKEEAQIFREAAGRLHLGRRQIAVAEDSLHCVETAKAAGFFTVGVYDPVSDSDWQAMRATATVTVTDLLEMQDIFR